MKSMIVLNGPARCGKNTIGEGLVNSDMWMRSLCDFKDCLTDMALEVSGIGRYTWNERYEERREQELLGKDVSIWMKDASWYRLAGLSQRQFLMKISEEWVKPLFGSQHFGQLLKDDIDSYASDGDVFINTSGGFNDELLPFCNDPDWQILLVRISRKGCTFANDSRKYITGNFNYCLDVSNDGDISNVVEEINEFIKENV